MTKQETYYDDATRSEYVFEKEIVVRYLEVKDIIVDSLELVAIGGASILDARKSKALTVLGIEHTESTYFQSYLKGISEENNVPYTIPIDKRVLDAMDSGALAFVFWLA